MYNVLNSSRFRCCGVDPRAARAGNVEEGSVSTMSGWEGSVEWAGT